MLRDCLMSLSQLQAPAGGEIAVVVVENDTQDNLSGLVAEISSKTGVAISYALETTRGIPFARNAALEAALSMEADWIALIDDDETARSNWLVNLSHACDTHAAEVANGPVHRIYEKEPPYWWKRQLLKPRETGNEITEAPTNNILMSRRIIDPQALGLRFEERLTNGAEDIDFFRRAHAAGAKMIWVDDALVDEFIPASRVERSRLLNRLIMAACSGTQMKILREGRGVAFRDHLPKSIRRMLVGLTAFVVGLPARLLLGQRGGRLLYYGLTRMCKGWGNMKGLTGTIHSYYHEIDGR